MPTVMITGSNRGLGLEFVRQYAADGWKVIATCRAPGRAEALRAVSGQLEVVALDVGDFAAVDALAARLRGQAIDVLIANAGIAGPEGMRPGRIDYSGWEEVLRINTLAPVKVALAFIDHVAASSRRLIAAVGSKMGSIADNSSGGSYAYRSSKAALNAAMKSLAVDLKSRGIRVAILHPGWVRTDMGGPGGLIDVTESVTGMRGVLEFVTIENSGRFFNYDGSIVPW